MSLSSGSKECHDICVRSLCHLKNTVATQESSIVLLAEFGYVTCSGTLYCFDLRNDGNSPSAAFGGVISISLFSLEDNILFALTDYGSVIALSCNGENCELVAEVLFDGIESILNYTIRLGQLTYDIQRNMLVLLREGTLSVHAVLGFKNELIEASTLFNKATEGTSTVFKLWGTPDVCVFVYSSQCEDISCAVLTRVQVQGREVATAWLPAPPADILKTKHNAWVTALSDVTSGCSEFLASGDCAGMLMIWRLSFDGALSGEVNLDKAEPKRKKKPLKVLLRNKTLCEGRSISTILIEPALSDLWVADVSGAVTNAQLSVASRTLHPVRRLLLFGTLGGPSFLHWKPNAAEPAESNPEDDEEPKAVKPAEAGLLRVFSPACGQLVECTILENIESVFKLWADPVGNMQPRPLFHMTGGKMGSGDMVGPGGNIVDACTMLPNLNMLATTNSRSRTIQMWDLDSGLLKHSAKMAEGFCDVLSSFDSSPLTAPEEPAEDEPVVAPAPQVSIAWLAAGYSNGEFQLLKLSCTTTWTPVPPQKHRRDRRASTKSNRPRHDSRLSAEMSRGSGQAPRQRLQSANDIDILDTVGPHHQQGVAYSRARMESEDLLDDGQLSDRSDASFRRNRLNSDEFLLGSDDDSVNGDGGAGRGGRRAHRIPQEQRSPFFSSQALHHTVEATKTFCPLPITDIFFSSSGDFIAVCHMRRTIVVYNNHVDAKKVSLRVTFDEMFCDIHTLVPTELTTEREQRRNVEAQLRRESSILAGRSRGRVHSEDRATSLPDASHDPYGSVLPTTGVDAVLQDPESLILVLQSATQIRLLDGIRGTVLTEFGLPVLSGAAVSSAVWDVPCSDNQDSSLGDRAFTGVCVAKDMSIFLFGERADTVRQYRLHDQQDLQVDATRSPVRTRFPQSTALTATHRTASFIRSFSALDNLVQGVTVRDLTSFAPLACVWSLRRLAVLRVQLLKDHGAEVLRSEEFALTRGKVRIVYASAMRAAPRTRNHRALLVLSDGHIIILHL